MHLLLLVSVFMFLTAFADQNNVHSGSSIVLGDDEFDPAIAADANAFIDPNGVPEDSRDSVAADPCGGTPSSESFLNPDIALDQALIDNTKKSRRDLGQDFESFRTAPAPPGLCRNRDQPANLEQPKPVPAPLPTWTQRCKGRYNYELCCIGTPKPMPRKPWKRAPRKQPQNVDQCVYSTLCPSL